MRVGKGEGGVRVRVRVRVGDGRVGKERERRDGRVGDEER